jgi:ribose 5-phosphate isomerase B
MPVKVALGVDHGGFPLKDTVRKVLESEGCEVLDLGTNSEEPVDYPDYALAVGEAVVNWHKSRTLPRHVLGSSRR